VCTNGSQSVYAEGVKLSSGGYVKDLVIGCVRIIQNFRVPKEITCYQTKGIHLTILNYKIILVINI